MDSSIPLKESEGTLKVFALTGIRSEYDLMYPLLKEISSDSYFELGVIVCGAHLTELHNYSVRQIEDDGFRIVEKIENLLYSNSVGGKVKSIGLLVQGLAQVLDREKPDLLIILGDREEVLAGSMAGAYMSIPIVHLAGGDNTYPRGGDVDEEVRHAATKLSHLHLTMTDDHSERIKKLGEESWRIHTVGSGGIDRLRQESPLPLDVLENELGEAVSQPYIVFIYHALSSEVEKAAKDILVCMDACLATGYHVFIGAPNSDPGYQDIIKSLEKYKDNDKVHFYKNLPRKMFASLLKNSICLVGNSSLSIHEGPYLGLPAVNVGERQRGRIAGNNVQFVPVDYSAIFEAINKIVNDQEYRESIKPYDTLYGDGFMAKRSVEILKQLPSKEKLLAKKLTY